MRPSQIIFLAGILAAVTAGCASVGHRIDQAEVDKIVIGTTTKADMLQTFGAPLTQTFNSDGKLVMTWIYTFVGPFGMGMQQQNLAVLFDQNNRVEKYSLTNSDENSPRLGH